jgi:hypothetical protein
MPQAAASPKIQDVDVPSISETFADSVRGLMFDGQSVRLELCVTRIDDPKSGNGEFTGRRQTACRVVLPLNAALELSNKLGSMLTTLAKHGAERKLKQGQPAPAQTPAQTPAQSGAQLN